MNRCCLVSILYLLPTLAVLADSKSDKLLESARAAIAQKKLEEAGKFLDQAIAADPASVTAYDLRGGVRFKLADISGSLADFDKQLEMDPDARPEHWRRGITCYYAGKFDD